MQASPEELKEALGMRNAVELDGRWQLVDEELLGALLEIIMLTAKQNDWKLDMIPEDEIMDAIVDSTYDARSWTADKGCFPVILPWASRNTDTGLLEALKYPCLHVQIGQAVYTTMGFLSLSTAFNLKNFNHKVDYICNDTPKILCKITSQVLPGFRLTEICRIVRTCLGKYCKPSQRGCFALDEQKVSTVLAMQIPSSCQTAILGWKNLLRIRKDWSVAAGISPKIPDCEDGLNWVEGWKLLVRL